MSCKNGDTCFALLSAFQEVYMNDEFGVIGSPFDDAFSLSLCTTSLISLFCNCLHASVYADLSMSKSDRRYCLCT